MRLLDLNIEAVHGELLNRATIKELQGVAIIAGMPDFVVLLVHLAVILIRLAKPRRSRILSLRVRSGRCPHRV
jgi:hypothetical protein